ncbi:unnamed protein product [Discosporangium mesarthrocarpum]
MRVVLAIAAPLAAVGFAIPGLPRLSAVRSVSRSCGCGSSRVRDNVDTGEATMELLHSGEPLRREEAVKLALAGFLTASTMLWWPKGVMAGEVGANGGTRTFRSQDYGFEVSYPAGWTTSERGNRLPLQSGTSSTGTVLAAGDYPRGLSLSVSRSDIRKLLEAMGYTRGGRLVSVQDVGKPTWVAGVLLRQRDGNMEEKNPLTKVVEARDDGDQLDFTVETIVKLIYTGAAPSAGEINPEPQLKRTKARSLLRNNGEMVTVWASALVEAWADEDVASELNGVLDSFTLTKDKTSTMSFF